MDGAGCGWDSLSTCSFSFFLFKKKSDEDERKIYEWRMDGMDG